MPKPYRDDQRRLMVTLSADRYNELKKTARAYSLSMTGIINNLIGDYLRAEREGGFDLTGAALADRVEILEKRFATLSAILTDKRGRKRQSVKHSETDLTPPTDNAPTFGSVPHDHGNGAPKTSTENKSDNGPKASTVDAPRLFAAIDPAPIRATTAEIKSTSTGNDAATSRPEPGAAIMETELPKGSTLEPRRADPHARAASIAQAAPARVALASSLVRESTTGTQRRDVDRRAEHTDDDRGNLRQRTPLEMRLEETKRRAAAYALHGGPLRQSYAIQGAY